MSDAAGSYRPRPIDTSSVEVTPELEELFERLSRNVHEIWASQRMSEGWTLGRERSDARREHPCLIPYDDLPESEKEVDRVVVRQTLLALLALGGGIQLPPPEDGA